MTRLSWPTKMFLALAVSALAATGCTGVDKSDCNDGFDNDGDGLIDGVDPGCDFNDGDLETPDPIVPQCSDGKDNDSDGLIDGDDPGCAGDEDDNEFNQQPPPQCSDGRDNDGDGRIDYPNDPGCAIQNEDDEAKDNCPDGLPCPTCSDGIDNDGDDVIDYPADPGCGFAADEDEFNTVPGVCGPSVDVIPLEIGTEIAGQHLGSVPNELQSIDCGGRGGETVYTVTVPETASLFVTTDFPETTLDTVLYVRGECRNPDTEVGCNDDDPDRSKVSTLLIPRVEPGAYFITVDSFGPGSVGDYKLQVFTFKGEGEECDPTAVPMECPPGLVCRLELPTSTAETCVPPECRDGNDNDGDGLLDFGDDPGCADDDDNDESDDCPDGPGCPECGNGVDDDADTFTDYPDDPGCTSAADNVELDECIVGVEVLEIPGGNVSGTTIGGSMSFTASCDSDSAESPERIHGFRTTFPLRSLTFSTAGSSFANTLYVRADDCATGLDVACADNIDGGFDKSVTIADPPVDTNYFAFVDGDWMVSGDYVLTVSGKIPGGDACTPGDATFTCELGFECDAGTETCVTATCNNGTDDDGDALIDWPDDPGCTDLSDPDETDDCPDGLGCPECGNGIDDDADLAIDFPDDPGCQFAADGSEIDECIAGVEVLEFDPEVGATGTTPAGGVSVFGGSCSTSTTSPEVVYAFRNTRDLTRLVFDTTASAFDTVTYVRLDDCALDAAEVACADPDAGGEIVTVAAPVIGTYFVFVDGNFATGAYDLQMTAFLPNGAPCDPAAAAFRCEDGFICDVGTTTCVPTACNNGTDDDGDTLVDDLDPGCASVLDNAEAPDPAPLPQCADGLDNDADAVVDFPADPGCKRASDDVELDCEDSEPVGSITGPLTTGDTSTATNDFVPSCVSTSTAPEVAFQLEFPGQLDTLSIDTSTSAYDTALYIKPVICDVPDLACDDDDAAFGLQSRIATDAIVTAQIPSPVAAGSYFVIVDGFGTSSGAFNLNITGTISAGAECDESQIASGLFSCASGACIDDGSGTFRCM